MRCAVEAALRFCQDYYKAFVEATVMFCLDDDRAFVEATVNEDGRAKARFKRVPPGAHHLTLKECDAPADVTCE